VTSYNNLCFLITKDLVGPFSIVSLQTDDTLFVGDDEFVTPEDKELKATNLLAKPAQTLTPTNPLAFNSYKLIIDTNRTILAIPKD
jgi:hypothetical protein